MRGLPFIDAGHSMALLPTSKVMREMAANTRRHQNNEGKEDLDHQVTESNVRMATAERRNSNLSLDLPVSGMRQPVLENAIFDDNSF